MLWFRLTEPTEMSRTDPQFNLRIPQELRNLIVAAAQSNKRSATAEILARLEETFAIEEALETVAPGAPVTGTAGLLLDMHAQLAERQADAHDSAMAAHAKEIEQYIGESGARIAEMADEMRHVKELLQALSKAKE